MDINAPGKPRVEMGKGMKGKGARGVGMGWI